MNDIIKKMREAGLSTKPEEPTVWVDTGSYALNWVISGRYDRGLPVGCMIQVKGDASTAKSVFVASILGSAQKKGYYVALADSENTLSPDFANHFGLDTENLIYCDPTVVPPSIEGVFEWLAKVITTIRSSDPGDDTPIVLALDSLPVLSPQKEFETEKEKGRSKSEEDVISYVQQNTDGMIRARLIGGALRKINGLLRKHNATFLIVNQIRETVVYMGDNSRPAAGGRALPFYLSVDLLSTSSKTTGQIREGDKKDGKVLGQRGVIKCTKNKISVPGRNCEWELYFNEGISSYYGLLACLVADGVATQSGAWYTINEKKFQNKSFVKSLNDLSIKELDPVRNLLGINLQMEV